MRKLLSILLCVLLCASFWVIPVRAEDNTLTITTTEEFLAFAENCRLDSYSEGRRVSLDADIDLTDVDFQGIPIFHGTFVGNDHTVSGISVTAQGSNIGLFRYVAEGAIIENLQAEGTVAPGGTAGNAGGIAGINAGTIQGCSFSGEITGTDNIGGIAGSNTLTGLIESCRTNATISGDHFVGGIAGGNSGVIRDCTNAGSINTTEKQNQVDISDITIDTLTQAESSMTVTDIGGIAGSSSGVIRDCENLGSIGYLHIGYNIGGIAGSQSGFLTECINNGIIHGRKDVGGIVGHLEPNTALIFEEDALQILTGQLNTLAGLTDKASANAGSTSTALRTQLQLLDAQVVDAKNAADKLRPQEGTVPDPDSILAAGNQLGSSLSGIGTTLGTISTQTESGTQTLVSDLAAIATQLDAIEKTLENSEDTVNTGIADVSDLDTEEDTTGKISLCTNSGTVHGDWNTGGIAGVISFENDLDPESDLDVLGNISLNHTCDIRAVIRSCANTATINGKKQNTGGIIGTMTLGLVRDCTVTGSVAAAAGEHTGGIAGRAVGGFIRFCYVKAAVTGAYRTGGIAGAAPVVTDCRSMVRLTGKEATGAVLGYADDRTQIAGNCYLAVGSDIGGIDGISYEGCAASLHREAFLALENLPELFKTNTITFRFPDGTEQVLNVPQGSNPNSADIPQVPSQSGTDGAWIGLDGATLENIIFDSVFEVSYDSLPITLASDAVRENGQAVLLVQGIFPMGSTLTAQPITVDDRMEACLEAWSFVLPEGAVQLRYRLPDGCDADRVLLRLQSADGTWRDVPFTVDGSYIVASAQSGDIALQLVKAPTDYTLLIVVAAGIVVLAAVFSTVLLVRRKKKK